MKKILFAFAFSVMISAGSLYAQNVSGSLDDGKTDVSTLPEPSALLLGFTGVSGVALWIRSRRRVK